GHGAAEAGQERNRARETSLHGARGRLAAVLRARSGRLPHRADRAVWLSATLRPGMGEPTTRRRRRSPAEAEREVLDAAEAFLRGRPLRELTIDEVMAETSLSRPAFYVYFRDRHDLVLRLIGELGAELFEMADIWLKGGDLPASVEGVVAVYAKHGRVLRAISDAAVDDPDVEE